MWAPDKPTSAARAGTVPTSFAATQGLLWRLDHSAPSYGPRPSPILPGLSHQLSRVSSDLPTSAPGQCWREGPRVTRSLLGPENPVSRKALGKPHPDLGQVTPPQVTPQVTPRAQGAQTGSSSPAPPPPPSPFPPTLVASPSHTAADAGAPAIPGHLLGLEPLPTLPARHWARPAGLQARPGGSLTSRVADGSAQTCSQRSPDLWEQGRVWRDPPATPTAGRRVSSPASAHPRGSRTADLFRSPGHRGRHLSHRERDADWT